MVAIIYTSDPYTASTTFEIVLSSNNSSDPTPPVEDYEAQKEEIEEKPLLSYDPTRVVEFPRQERRWPQPLAWTFLPRQRSPPRNCLKDGARNG